MIDQSLAHDAHQSTEQKSDLGHISGIAARVLRGQELYLEPSVDFEHKHGAWLIASDTVPGRVYEVRLGPVETCECADHEHRGQPVQAHHRRHDGPGKEPRVLLLRAAGSQ